MSDWFGSEPESILGAQSQLVAQKVAKKMKLISLIQSHENTALSEDTLW